MGEYRTGKGEKEGDRGMLALPEQEFMALKLGPSSGTQGLGKIRGCVSLRSWGQGLD